MSVDVGYQANKHAARVELEGKRQKEGHKTSDSEQMTRPELLEQIAEAERRQGALMEEIIELAARLPDIRAAFGNPFTHSRPDDPNDGPANFTGYSSHAVSLPTLLELRRLEQRLKELKVDLDALDSQSDG